MNIYLDFAHTLADLDLDRSVGAATELQIDRSLADFDAAEFQLVDRVGQHWADNMQAAIEGIQ